MIRTFINFRFISLLFAWCLAYYQCFQSQANTEMGYPKLKQVLVKRNYIMLTILWCLSYLIHSVCACWYLSFGWPLKLEFPQETDERHLSLHHGKPQSNTVAWTPTKWHVRHWMVIGLLIRMEPVYQGSNGVHKQVHMNKHTNTHKNTHKHTNTHTHNLYVTCMHTCMQKYIT